MAQVFADDFSVGRPGMLVRPAQIPTQVGHGSIGPARSEPPELGSTMTPGKGVRRIRCAGCSHDTLPRNGDGAPLCARCSELLATGGTRIDLFAASTIFRAPRWLRRRPTLR